MLINALLPPPRLVASGGPVTRAIRAVRDDHDERQRLAELRDAIMARISADLDLLDRLSHINADRRAGGAR